MDVQIAIQAKYKKVTQRKISISKWISFSDKEIRKMLFSIKQEKLKLKKLISILRLKNLF